MLGVNNVGIGEKKEHLIVDEVNANNEEIDTQAVSFKSEIEDCFERVNQCFNHQVYVVDMNELVETNENEEDNEDKEDDDNDSNNQ
jgi:hypothetical protein